MKKTLSIPFGMLHCAFSLKHYGRFVFQSLLGCFYIIEADRGVIPGLSFQSLLGCFKANYLNGIAQRTITFNPFWDASVEKKLLLY